MPFRVEGICGNPAERGASAMKQQEQKHKPKPMKGKGTKIEAPEPKAESSSDSMPAYQEHAHRLFTLAGSTHHGPFFFGNKMAAKKMRDWQNRNGGDCHISPGPDHHRFHA